MQPAAPKEDRELFYVNLRDACCVCATYCMRRVGFRGRISEFLSIEPDAYDEWALARGDIVVWKTDNDGMPSAIEISGSRIITSYLAYNRHYGVYEGGGLVSDTVLVGDMQLPNIRFRRLSDISRAPDGVIRLPDKDVKNIRDAATDTSQTVRQDGMQLACTPYDQRDREMCMAAVQQNGTALKHVPYNLLDREMCLAAVQKDGWALVYVPKELCDREICLAAVKQNGTALKFVPYVFRDQEMCMTAVQQNECALQYVPVDFRSHAQTVKEEERR